MPTYARLPVSFVRGEGIYLFDSEGRRYMDAIAGIGVNALGHAHPALVAAVQEQAAKLIHTSNLYHINEQEALAANLTGVAGMESCFFGNSGAEANEAAIKLARLYGHQRGVDKPAIIVMERSFHGRTLATLSATGNRKIQAGFEPLVSGFVRAPMNDIQALRQIATNNPDVVAVLLEPIQGEGGLHPADTDYLQAVRALCDNQQWLLMLDEVQTGNGRTGSYFAYQQLGFTPDVVTTAKGLGNGLPIGACLARGEAARIFCAGHHGSTYGGNPLVCAAANTVVNTIVNEGLAQQAAQRGEQLRAALARELADDDRVVDIRGRGLMVGVELNRDCGALVGLALQEGLLINVTAGNVLRLLPPLIISETQVDELAAAIGKLLRAYA
ncbi:aspartate aminotransferase family protein [Parahaliea aestuarii]|uniref:Acetylornithine aminotransferase n=1 Tax=Parahaliea aestuarii TaxID=1852021 RepID=A0A5C8ZQ78_9GAMM|nr:aspartate aminotransferase family protein [Parahaliea aestuarii]TXS90646.1 aspartate aminotransferase family protein [Parahaliea aestuarii]